MINPYVPIEAVIEDIVTETPNIKTFILRPKEEITFKAGQFVELTVPGLGEAPFTPSSAPYEKERIELTIMKVGDVTSALHDMLPKEIVGIRGPFGQGYPLSDFYGKEILIVGGGVGLAPLRSLFLALLAEKEKFKKISLRYGARTPADLVYKEALKKWSSVDKKVEVITTVDVGDSSWKGNVGLVTSICEEIEMDRQNCAAIVCGPPIMMKFTTFKLLDQQFAPKDIYLSMEKNMSCGVGKCGHCMLGPYFVCKDGPVFTYDKIKDIVGVFD